MRFHDRSKFEIHVYATSPPDTSAFTEFSMRGVDWREKIRKSVEFFHDTSNLNFIETSKLIRSDGIHILLNWDGYSNNGVRRTGLFPMQSAPIQIAHQEYIGTMGADYVQYLITGVSYLISYRIISFYFFVFEYDSFLLLLLLLLFFFYLFKILFVVFNSIYLCQNLLMIIFESPQLIDQLNHFFFYFFINPNLLLHSFFIIYSQIYKFLI